MDEIEKLKLNDEFNAWYNAEKVEEKCRNSAYSEGYTKGAASGVTIGEKHKQLEIANSLLNTDMSINEISKHTGLTISELEGISNNKS